MVEGLQGNSAADVCSELDTMLDQLSQMKATDR